MSRSAGSGAAWPLGAAHRRGRGLVLLVLLVGLVPGTVRAQASFQGLGSLPGAVPGSVATDVSADGQVVVGGCPAAATCTEAWRWIDATGIQGLGKLAGEGESFATAVSGDGSVVLGLSGSVFRWTSGGGMTDIGVGLPASDLLSAEDLSSDGLVAVGGFAEFTGFTGGAWRWTSGVGVEILETFVLPDTISYRALSADGAVIAGSEGLNDDPEAFVRTGATTTFLPELPSPGCQCGSFPAGLSEDGAIVVGSSHEQPFVWQAGTGIVGLGFLPGTSYGVAGDVSAGGSVIVGDFAGTVPFVWTPGTGLRDLRQVLLQLGLDVAGWQLEAAVAVSSDGTVLVGNGLNPSGRPEAWRAVIPSVPPAPTPTPSLGGVGTALVGGSLVVAGAVGAARRRRRARS